MVKDINQTYAHTACSQLLLGIKLDKWEKPSLQYDTVLRYLK